MPLLPTSKQFMSGVVPLSATSSERGSPSRGDCHDMLAFAEGQSRALSKRTKIVVLVSGSRGDMQPLIALSKQLQNSGYSMLLLTNSNHVGFAENFGLRARAVLPDTENFLQKPAMKEFMATGNIRRIIKDKDIAEEQNQAFANSLDEGRAFLREFRPQVILASASDFVAGMVFSRLFDIPVIHCSLQPNKPTKYIKSLFNEPSLLSGLAWKLLWRLTYKDFKTTKWPIIFEKFGAELDAPLWPNFQSAVDYLMAPIAPELLGVSPSLLERPKDWPSCLDRVHITGFWTLGQQEQRERQERKDSNFGGESLTDLQTFLAADKRPPVYIGWGSMTAGSAEQMALLAVRSLKLAGERGIVLGGWAKLNATMVKNAPDGEELEEYLASNIIFVDSAPHEWLFPRCSVTVHHGGAGTTAAALRSGKPTIITPCFLDQYGNAQLTLKSGVGVQMPQFCKVTAEQLSAAITRCIADAAMNVRSMKLGEALQKEDGLVVATEIIDSFVASDLASGAWRQRFEAQKSRSMRARGGIFGCCARRAPLSSAVMPKYPTILEEGTPEKETSVDQLV